MLYIMTNARVLSKLRVEICEANPTRPTITDAEARSMPYLQAVIKEGLRIFPPVAGLMAKEVPQGGDTYKGVFLPEGTRLSYCAWGVARWPEVWGDDAHEFRPERWTEAPAEKLREMNGTIELVFGYGKWQCLGRNVALMELNKVIVEVKSDSQPSGSIALTLFTADYALRLLSRRPHQAVALEKPWHFPAVGILGQSISTGRGYGAGSRWCRAQPLTSPLRSLARSWILDRDWNGRSVSTDVSRRGRGSREVVRGRICGVDTSFEPVPMYPCWSTALSRVMDLSRDGFRLGEMNRAQVACDARRSNPFPAVFVGRRSCTDSQSRNGSSLMAY